MSIYIQFYDSTTGLFTGVSMHTNLASPKAIKEFIAENTPAGHGAFVGYVDPLSQKMDLATGKLVDYRPPQPSPKHEWNVVSKRWQRPVGLKRSAALARIAELEKGQHRTVRETLIRACHAVDAIKEALAPEAEEVRAAVDRMYSALSRLELLEAELGQLRADLG
jgi:translation initiation factor 2 gamma subunit (eIF-2gamma)